MTFNTTLRDSAEQTRNGSEWFRSKGAIFRIVHSGHSGKVSSTVQYSTGFRYCDASLVLTNTVAKPDCLVLQLGNWQSEQGERIDGADTFFFAQIKLNFRLYKYNSG